MDEQSTNFVQIDTEQERERKLLEKFTIARFNDPQKNFVSFNIITTTTLLAFVTIFTAAVPYQY